jgi:hypothetical protein
MRRSFWVIVIALLGSLRCAAGTLQLHNDQITIEINPATLAVTANPSQSPLTLSAGTGPFDVANLTQAETSASWSLSKEHITVSMKLDGRALVAQFTAENVGDFTWPILPASQQTKAYLLPLCEGHYIPVDDADWQKELTENGPFEALGLSLPLWGVECGDHTITYLVTHPFNSDLTFTVENGKLASHLVHHFTRNWKVKQYDLRITVGDPSPIEPARVYRQWVTDRHEFVSMKEKIAQTPDAAKLMGAAHIYLYGDDLLSRYNVKDWKKFAAALLAADKDDKPSIAKRIVESLDADTRKALDGAPTMDVVDRYTSGVLAAGISTALSRKDLQQPATDPQANCAALYTQFADFLQPVNDWGDGVSTTMVQKLADAGLDRLWLGAQGSAGLENHPAMVKAAKDKGYLVGFYDSYNSIHSPEAKKTWETAQFDEQLYETGPIVKADGTKRPGFNKIGYLLSPLAARPAMEKRVTKSMHSTAANSFMMDCDAFGECYDDYSPLHPATEADDMAARNDRMAWIVKTFHAVIGSEGGVWYSAPVIHFSHGMTTGVIGWGDKDMTDRKSPYFQGAYWPPDGPAILLKAVPLKDKYIKLDVDPRYRLPLYEIAFHDSVVSNEEAGSGTLKFSNVQGTRMLTELLYGTPPMYHLNQAQWEKQEGIITRQFAFFSPLHREIGLLPMTDFKWLSEDRAVQETVFGDHQVELVANFGSAEFTFQGQAIPAGSILAYWPARKGGRLFTAPN